jgi:ribosomal protein L9
MDAVSDNREMYNEINALVGSIAKALEMEDKLVAQELESGAIVIAMDEDENGHRFLAVTRGDRTARVYQGAIQYDRPPGGSEG